MFCSGLPLYSINDQHVARVAVGVDPIGGVARLARGRMVVVVGGTGGDWAGWQGLRGRGQGGGGVGLPFLRFFTGLKTKKARFEKYCFLA